MGGRSKASGLAAEALRRERQRQFGRGLDPALVYVDVWAPGDEPVGGAGKGKLWMALGGLGIVAVGAAAVLLTRGGAPTPAPPPIAATPASAAASVVAAAPNRELGAGFPCERHDAGDV